MTNIIVAYNLHSPTLRVAAVENLGSLSQAHRIGFIFHIT